MGKKELKRIVFLVLLLAVSNLNAAIVNGTFLFKNGKEGYNVYRIPAVIKTGTGRLLAFCEGRKSLMDHGDIDMVMKFSDDNGNSWSKLQVMWNNEKNTCGNPSPVYNSITGEIILIGTLNNDRVFIIRSKDNGASWLLPEEITTMVKPTGWEWYACGPGHAIQLVNAAHKGRIVVPCNHTLSGNRQHISHIIYSDDNGKTWAVGGAGISANTDECTVAELTDGRLMLNMRNNTHFRKVSLSSDYGVSWSAPILDSSLIEPICEGTLLSYSLNPDILLFVNPADREAEKD